LSFLKIVFHIASLKQGEMYYSDAVVACAWNPTGRSLLSCDKHKTVIFWSD